MFGLVAGLSYSCSLCLHQDHQDHHQSTGCLRSTTHKDTNVPLRGSKKQAELGNHCKQTTNNSFVSSFSWNYYENIILYFETSSLFYFIFYFHIPTARTFAILASIRLRLLQDRSELAEVHKFKITADFWNLPCSRSEPFCSLSGCGLLLLFGLLGFRCRCWSAEGSFGSGGEVAQTFMERALTVHTSCGDVMAFVVRSCFWSASWSHTPQPPRPTHFYTSTQHIQDDDHF